MMEVCGGHTHAIYRFGLKDILPENIELIHGPGSRFVCFPWEELTMDFPSRSSRTSSSPRSAT
jgi:hydrogenase expression/formation protein HypD